MRTINKAAVRILLVIIVVVSGTAAVLSNDSAAAGGSVSFSTDDVSGNVGDIVEVSVDLDVNPGVWAFGVYVAYDPAVVEFLPSDSLFTGGFASGNNILNGTTAGWIVVLYENIALENNNSVGKVALLKFKIIDSSKTDIKLSPGRSSAYSADGKELTMNFSDGSVSSLPSDTEYYTITYNANGGSFEKQPPEQYALPGSTVNIRFIEIPVKDGFVFDGWSTENEQGQNYYKDPSSFTVTEDTSFYAVWVAAGGSDGGGGTPDNNGGGAGNSVAIIILVLVIILIIVIVLAVMFRKKSR